ncbi:MAG: hypothetical protein AB7I38_11250 [Dehalococcoidia bacterium]
MARRPVLAYAIGGTAAAIAAIVITASTVGLTPSTSEGSSDQAGAPAVLPAENSPAFCEGYEDDEGEDEEDEHEYYRAADGRVQHEGRGHDDDD